MFAVMTARFSNSLTMCASRDHMEPFEDCTAAKHIFAAKSLQKLGARVAHGCAQRVASVERR
jgi:hypothetical protein